MTEYVWSSPGGLYVVPDDFRQRFLAEFPDYRIRWSLRDRKWQIEQRCGAGALPPLHISAYDDSLIRARDGYWLVMSFHPGDRMPCLGMIDKATGDRCGYTLKVPHMKTAEVVCPACRRAGRDGRQLGGYWPFTEALMERLRFTDPLRAFTQKDKDGHTRVLNGIQRARDTADARNKQLMHEAEAKRIDATTSIDAVDYRWLTGIASSSGRRRQLSPGDFT